jgi:hypothetical protein
LYAIVLIDGEYADTYATLDIFEDKTLWDWLHAPVEFGDKASVTVPLPAGYALDGKTSVDVSIGSTENDKAQIISGLLDSVKIEVDEDDLDDEDYDEDYDTAWRKQAAAVCATRGVTSTYEGLWY